jgi:hypothetical protein
LRILYRYTKFFFAPVFFSVWYYAPTVQCIIADRRARKHKKKTHFLKKLIPFLQEKKIIQNWQDKISFVCVCVCVCVYTIVSRCPSPHLPFFTIHLKFRLFIVSSLENTFLGRLVLLNINIILTHTHTRDGKNCTCNVIFFVCLFVLPVCLFFFFHYYYFWQICAPAPILSFHKKKLMMK